MGSELKRRATELHVLYSSTHKQLLDVIAEVEARESYKHDGAPTIEAWVAQVFGVSFGAAKGWVEAARALEDLPTIADDYAEGKLSWDKVKTVTTYATPETDSEVAAEA